MHDYRECVLSRHTPPGLFFTKSFKRIWVFDTVGGRVAVHLDADFHVPQFGYRLLNDIPYRVGRWGGKVVLQTRRPDRGGYRGYTGIIRFYRGHVSLKVTSPNGQGKYLRLLQYRARENLAWSEFSTSWKLFDDPDQYDFEDDEDYIDDIEYDTPAFSTEGRLPILRFYDGAPFEGPRRFSPSQ